jgi:hypothetical protein
VPLGPVWTAGPLAHKLPSAGTDDGAVVKLARSGLVREPGKLAVMGGHGDQSVGRWVPTVDHMLSNDISLATWRIPLLAAICDRPPATRPPRLRHQRRHHNHTRAPHQASVLIV